MLRRKAEIQITASERFVTFTVKIPYNSDEELSTILEGLHEKKKELTEVSDFQVWVEIQDDSFGSYFFTEIQIDIIILLAKGFSLPSAAKRLNININNAKRYLKEIHKKLDVDDKASLVRMAIKLGIVSL